MNCANCKEFVMRSGRYRLLRKEFCCIECLYFWSEKRGALLERERIMTLYKKAFNGQNKQFINAVAAKKGDTE
jgi:hypothetical protein